MLDPKFILQHADAVKANMRRRTPDHDDTYLVDRLAQLLSSKKESQRTRDLAVHHQRQMQTNIRNKQGAEKEELQASLRALSQNVKTQDAEISQCDQDIKDILTVIPNMTHPEVEDKIRVIKTYGEPKIGNFKNHIEIAEHLDIVNFKDASRISGSKFYYLKGTGVLLQQALIRFALDNIASQGFTLYETPDVAFDTVIEQMGFAPRGASSQIYNLSEHQSLIGTSEITLGALYAETHIDKNDLPLRCGGLSHCFRKEAGTYGKESQGLFRVHQFTKVEMFVFCLPEQGEEMLGELLGVEEKIYRLLALPYRIVDIPPNDLGAPAYRKYDIEAWMPGRGDWGEVTSCSNCTDFQARRLNTKTETGLVHTLNGTALACPRTIIAILENYQQEDGSVAVPQVLQKYMGMEKIKPGG